MNTLAKSQPSKTKRARIPVRMAFTNPWSFLGLGFGSGLSPKAPGTLGTIAAIPLYLLIAGTSIETYLAVTTILFFIGIPICAKTEQQIGIQDHSGIVWDEVVGFLVTMTLIPNSWPGIVVGFLFFRLFDVLKPWPIRWFDKRVHGGFGIMLDDVIAGLMACLATHAAMTFLNT